MARKKYKTNNWSEYDKSLVQRGYINIWLSQEAIAQEADQKTQPSSHNLPVQDHTTLWIKSTHRHRRPNKGYTGYRDNQGGKKSIGAGGGQCSLCNRHGAYNTRNVYNHAIKKEYGIRSRVENVFYRLKRFFGCVRSKLESMRKVELLLLCKVLNIVRRAESYALETL